MKKNIMKVVGASTIIGILVLNFILGNNAPAQQENFSLQNLTALHASAAELYCDRTNTTTCTITSSGNSVSSTGFLIFK